MSEENMNELDNDFNAVSENSSEIPDRIRQDGTRAIKLEELSNEELIEKVKQLTEQLKKDKAFGLVFERQTEDAVLNRKKTVPIIFENKEKYVSNGGNENMLIIGDNFDSLTSLLQTHRGKIDVIYIDPPYNTGREDFIYNDKYVNPEDSFRHSKWLSFVENRITLAKELLSESGVLILSIDDNEQATSKLLLDSIFGVSNFIATLPRLTSAQRPSQEKFVSITHDYIHMYAKNSNNSSFNKVIDRAEGKTIIEDEIGKYIKGDTSPILASSTQGYSEGGDYDFEYNGKRYSPISSDGSRRRWLWSIGRMEKAAELGILVETKNGLRVQNYIDMEYQVGTNIMQPKEQGLILSSNDLMSPLYVNSKGSNALKTIVESDFDFPKPIELMKLLVSLHPNNDAIVLDFFAGSGTIGHAVLELNKEDGGNRKFILCTNDEAGIGETVTYERIKRVITGEEWADGKEHGTHDASLRYYNVQHVNRDDNMENSLLEKLEDIVKIKEDAFITVSENEAYKVFTNKESSKYVAILKNRRKLYDLTESLEDLLPSELVIYNNGSSYIDEDCIQEMISKGWVVSFIEYPKEFINDYKFVDEKLGIKNMKEEK